MGNVSENDVEEAKQLAATLENVQLIPEFVGLPVRSTENKAIEFYILTAQITRAPPERS